MDDFHDAAALRFGNDPVIYEFPDGLATGTRLTMPEQNGFTVDAATRGERDLGSKTSLSINGEEETIHTSCSTPFRTGEPAPLDDPKGEPSSLWFVVNFRQVDD
jgi:hypothetical protein